MKLSMIWAMDKNNLIGRDNELPWHLPNDLQYFRKVTERKPVIMGYATFLSIGKPLPNRRNIVLNFNKIEIPGCEVATSIDEALSLVGNEGEVFIIGGASIYRQFLDKVDRLYITFIDEDFEGNIYFPQFDLSKWRLVKETKGIKDKDNPYDYYFRVYEK